MHRWRNILVRLIAIGTSMLVLTLVPELPFELSRKSGSISVESGSVIFLSRAAILVIFVYQTFLLFKSITSKSLINTITHAACALLAICTFIFSSALHQFVQIGKVDLLPKRYAQCSERAIEYVANNRFAVCDYRQIYDTYTFIVFDTGDQIFHFPNHVDPQLHELIEREGFVVLGQCPFNPIHIRDHFYLIVTAC